VGSGYLIVRKSLWWGINNRKTIYNNNNNNSRKTAASGSDVVYGGGGGGQECGVMGTEVTRLYGDGGSNGGIGGHVELMDNIMSVSLNRVWTGGTVFFRQPTDQQSLVGFFDILFICPLRSSYPPS